MADLSSILGGMVQGFKDFGTGLVDMFGTGGAAIGDAITSIQTGRATTKNQDDFRKWLYNTDSTKDAAAKGLGTILNGVSTVADVIPGTQAVTANPLFNGLQGAIGGVSDELKMAGENADLGRAAQRAGVGAASGLASGYAGQALGKTGNKLLSNGLTRGAVSGALGGGIANAGYTGIEGGSVQDMINAGLYGAQTGALVGGTTGLARELIKPTHKMDVALTDDEKAARIANIDDQIGKLDLSTPEGNARYNELAQQRQQYSGNKRLYRGLGQEYDPNYPKNKLDTQGYESWTDNPELARQYGENVYYIDVPEGDIKTSYLDENPMSETYGDRNPIYSIDKKAGLNGVSGGEYLLSVDDPYKEGLTYNRLGNKPKTVADLMNEPKQKTVADLMLSPEQKEYFKDSVIRDENGNLKKMYHGTPDGDFKKFREGSFFTDDKDYADTYQDEYAGITQAGKKGANPKTYEVYLDVKKPFSMADPEARRIINDEYIKRDRGYWVGDVDNTEVDFTEADNLRKWLQKNHPEYDGMYVNEGGGDDPFAGDGWEEWRGNSIVPFNANQIKDVNNLMPTSADSIMASKNIGGSSESTEAKGAATRVGSKNVAQVDLNTLPESMKAAKSYLNKDYIKDIESYSGKKIGDMTDAELMEYALKDKPAETRDIYRVGIEDIVKGGKTMRQVAENYAANRYLRELADKNFDDIDSKALVSYLLNNAHRLNDSKTRAADIELSDRLGIGQSNTFMDDYRVPYGAQGVFDVADSTISIRPELSQESAVNTVAHERLHSFQTENDIKRYDKRVLSAYDDLAKELKPLLKTPEETAKRYRFDADYWGNEREQQSRMLQQYLENKGYTKGGLQEANVGEWGNEINPAFDKFFDKLRTLSKKGVALPALSALFGGGAIMAATQGDDKKKKSEVK